MEERSGVKFKRRAFWAAAAAPLGVAALSVGSGASAKSSRDKASARLGALESRNEIAEVLYAYARANDRKDEALLRSCFWPESTHRHGRFDGTSTEFIGFAFKIVNALHYASHHISNVSIRVEGDKGFSECYYFAHHRRAAADGEGEEDAFFQGRYIDLHERRDNGWKIIQRRGLSDYSVVTPASGAFADWNPEHRSLNAPDDPYYAMLQKFNSGD